MSKTLNKYVTVLNYADKTLLVLLGARTGFLLSSFTTVIGTPVGIASASISLVSVISNGIFNIFLKTIGKAKNKYRKITVFVCLSRSLFCFQKVALLVKSKLNRIEKVIPKALIYSDISHEELTLVINEKQLIQAKGKHQSKRPSAGQR